MADVDKVVKVPGRCRGTEKEFTYIRFRLEKV
jgi:hypothetical protein